MIRAGDFHIMGEETIFATVASPDINPRIECIGGNNARSRGQVF
jgi:hypothetical protein